MDTLQLLKALHRQRASRSDLRVAASTLGLELARGVVRELKPVLDELGWVDVAAADAPYLLALRDVVSALVAERAALAQEQAAARQVQPRWWAVLESLQRHRTPRTATELARELRRSVSSVHRWLVRLQALDLVTDDLETVPGQVASAKERPFALTAQALAALDARSSGPDGDEPWGEREQLHEIVVRPIERLQMEPLDRTLYWALLHWAAELLADDDWSAAEARVARDLRRFLVALGQADAYEVPFAPCRERGSSGELLEVLWSYRTLRGQLDQTLEEERRFAAAKPPAGAPEQLAWAVAAIRVAHSARLVATDDDSDDALRTEATELEARLRREAAAALDTMNVPLAIFWRDLIEVPQAHAVDIDARLRAADLGSEPGSVAFRNLAMCREHLRIAARSNLAWQTVEPHLRAMWEHVTATHAHVQWTRPPEAAAWMASNHAAVEESIIAFVAACPDLIASARHWISTVDLDAAAQRVGTVAGDRNLFRYRAACESVIALGTGAPAPRARWVATPHPVTVSVPGTFATPKHDQLRTLTDLAQMFVTAALVRRPAAPS